MPNITRFKDELRAAYNQGYIHNVTDKYVKLRWWSMRSYFNTVSAWRARLIGTRVKKRINAAHSRAEARREADNAHRIKRADAFGDAADSIDIVNN